MARRAFDMCDLDKSGKVDKTELWAGILLLYHKLNRYCLGSRYVPPRKKLVFKMFDFYDYDSSGTLELDEFVVLARHLCKDIFSEFMEKVYLTFFAIPLISYFLTPYIHSLRYQVASGKASYIPNESAIISFVTSLLIFLVPWLLHGIHLLFAGRIPSGSA